MDAIAHTLDDMQSAGLLDEQPESICRRIFLTGSLAHACARASLVQENLPEDVETKREIFAKLCALSPPDAILASSTSWLPASRFTEALVGRDRCLVAHPTNPPNLVPLVEICPAPWTSEEAIERAITLYTAVGQKPVLVRQEIEGFLLNRIQGAVLNEMLNLFEQGFATSADLDKVMKYGLGLRWSFMGPFETIDLNAPLGVQDYAKRYGGTYARISEGQSSNRWAAGTLAQLESERRTELAEGDLASRASWRDRRLMALRSHQKHAKDCGD
ncbi:L-carnitine dehydrogenase [compost metagenome]